MIYSANVSLRWCSLRNRCRIFRPSKFRMYSSPLRLLYIHKIAYEAKHNFTIDNKSYTIYHTFRTSYSSPMIIPLSSIQPGILFFVVVISYLYMTKMKEGNCLAQNTIQIYLMDIFALNTYDDYGLSLITPNRRRQAETLKCQEDRIHCIAGGLLLRAVLGVRHDDEFGYTTNGKPYLISGKISFSLSHGGRFAALALSEVPVGLDVEPLGPANLNVAKRFFTPDEQAWMAEEDEDKRFFLLWTRKESVIKADGRGLSMPLESFSVLTNNEWATQSVIYDNHAVACAARRPFNMLLTKLSGHAIFEKEPISLINDL